MARLVPSEPHAFVAKAGQRLDIAVLVAFPFLLYRFTTAFSSASNRLERFVSAMTATLVVWTFVLPYFPHEGQSRPAWFDAYLVAFLIHWSALSVVVTWRLWRAGRGQPGVARRRMHMLGAASAGLTAAIFLSATTSHQYSVPALASAVVAFVSALAFLLGLAPPAVVRLLWRRPENERVQRAIVGLMSASTEQEVADQVLPPFARIVGARAVALRAADGRLVGAHGFDGAALRALEAGERPAKDGGELLELDTPAGTFVLSLTPYAPFFGGDELALVRTLGALTGVALDRSRLFAQEREARLALERADELKTNFVALAAHELRTPVTAVRGIIQTLDKYAGTLEPERERELQATLRMQGERLGVLVEQLLDLSRLDAEAIAIEPRRLPVRQRLEDVVAAAAAGRAGDVEIDAPSDLEAVVDPGVLDRIVTNLVANAFRYGQPPVRVTAEQRDRHFRIRVEDHGPGVPPEFVPDLFERFTRSAATRERTSGTGLGLAIARSYAQAHRGDLVYQPAQPRGACFELILPTDPGQTSGET